METLLPLIFAFTAGAGAGLLYFFGLALTVRRIRVSARPGLVLAVSGVVRTGMILAVFFTVTRGQWQGILACTAGFVSARQIMILLYHPEKSGVRN